MEQLLDHTTFHKMNAQPRAERNLNAATTIATELVALIRAKGK
jgi:hypothetical protein